MDKDKNNVLDLYKSGGDKNIVLDLLEKKYEEQDEKNVLQYMVKEFATRNGIPIYSNEQIIRTVNKEYGVKNLCNYIDKFK